MDFTKKNNDAPSIREMEREREERHLVDPDPWDLGVPGLTDEFFLSTAQLLELQRKCQHKIGRYSGRCIICDAEIFWPEGGEEDEKNR
jgi:hypothetical protein